MLFKASFALIASCMIVGAGCGAAPDQTDSESTGSQQSAMQAHEPTPAPLIPPVGGSWSTPACTDCRPPKGYALIPTAPGERCMDKRIECMCGSPPVWSLQGVCVYPIETIPTVELTPPTAN